MTIIPEPMHVTINRICPYCSDENKSSNKLVIYCASWNQEGFGLSAIIIAKSEEEAVKLLELNEEYETLFYVKSIGEAFFNENPGVLVRQSL